MPRAPTSSRPISSRAACWCSEPPLPRGIAEPRRAWNGGTASGFGLDYAETLRRWRDALSTRPSPRSRLPAGFDHGFLDLWRYYLMYCEGGFRGGGIDVAQVTLVKAPEPSG